MGSAFTAAVFDGGGIFGLYSISMFLRLLEERPRLLENIDLFAGTSTGGIIALCLASGINPHEIQSLYINRAKEIFHRPWSHLLLSPFGLTESKYDNTGLIQVCHDTLGDRCLGDLGKWVCVPAFNLKSEATPNNPSWRARVFQNLEIVNNPDLAESVVDVAVRTSSAPTFFPSYQGYVDGGLFNNSPIVTAISKPIALLGVKLEDIRVLSIGTGGQIKYIDGQQLQWGVLNWVRDVISILMDGQSLKADMEGADLLGERYHRLCPIVPDWQMDDLSKIQQLQDLANQAPIEETIRFIDEHFLTGRPIKGIRTVNHEPHSTTA